MKSFLPRMNTNFHERKNRNNSGASAAGREFAFIRG
jgi:hypothetical protein